MEDILQYIAETCSGVEEVDVTACSNETVLRVVATRSPTALSAPLVMDLFVLLRSLGEEGKRYSVSVLALTWSCCWVCRLLVSGLMK